MPCIAAFTPHHGGAAGLTVAEYEIDAGKKEPK
jgi:hypothetical protein